MENGKEDDKLKSKLRSSISTTACWKGLKSDYIQDSTSQKGNRSNNGVTR